MSLHTFYNAIFSGCGAGNVTGVDKLRYATTAGHSGLLHFFSVMYRTWINIFKILWMLASVTTLRFWGVAEFWYKYC